MASDRGFEGGDLAGAVRSWLGVLFVSALLAGVLVTLWWRTREVRDFASDDTSLMDFRVPVRSEKDARPVEVLSQLDPSARQAVLADRGLQLQIYLLAPSAFGVAEWQLGASAQYRYKRDAIEGADPQDHDARALERDLSVRVVGRVEMQDVLVKRFGAHPGDHWLEFFGLTAFRDMPHFNYMVARPDDLRPSRSAPMFSYQPKYPPHMEGLYDLSGCEQATCVRLGREICQTPAGEFDTEHVELWLGTIRLEAWVRNDVAPLGLVRLRNAREEIVLVQHAANSAIGDFDDLIAPLVGGQSTYAFGCLGCHPSMVDCHSTSLPAR